MHQIIALVLSFSIVTNIHSQTGPESPFSSADNESVGAYELALKLNDRSYNTSERTSNKTYQLDSTYAFFPQRTIGSEDRKSAVRYKYRELGLNDETYSWNCSGTFCNLTPRTVTTREYNSDNQLVGISGASWDGVSCMHDFELPHITEFIYNDRGMLTMFKQERSQGNYTYNNLDLLEKYTIARRDSELDTFMVGTEFYYTYNDQNLLETILQTSYRANFGGFIPTDSSYYKYYDSGQLQTKETFFIIEVDPEVVWKASEFRKYTYNADNTINTEEYYDLILVDPDTLWRYQELSEYDYNPQGSLDKVSYYDVVDRNNPELVFLREYTYDRNILLDDIQFPRFRETIEGQKHMLLKEVNTTFTGLTIVANSELEPVSREFFYKRNDSVSTSDTETLTLSISPNPVQDILYLEIEDLRSTLQFQIYDTSGRPHLSVATRDNTIDVSGLPSGIYFYRISTGGKIGTGRFVKM